MRCPLALSRLVQAFLCRGFFGCFFGFRLQPSALDRHDAPSLVFQLVEFVVIAGLKVQATWLAADAVLVAEPKRGAGRPMDELVALQHELLGHHLHMHLTVPTVQASGSLGRKLLDLSRGRLGLAAYPLFLHEPEQDYAPGSGVSSSVVPP
jgi:hypothetical protein